MKLCVGAVSRRVIEEAAKLGVHQIIASRRQVNIDGGYTNITPKQLVAIVRMHSKPGSMVEIVRDHGGPNQGGFTDDGIAAFDADVDAGFDTLHIDVCNIPRSEQINTLIGLVRRYHSRVNVQIGGERDEQAWLDQLLHAVLPYATPSYTVVDLGGHIDADKQQGTRFLSIDDAWELTSKYNNLGTKTVAHNMDFVGHRLQYHGAIDAYNIAPEFGIVEIDAILTVLPFDVARDLLEYAYLSRAWRRWFAVTKGTWLDRAKCALRYIMHTDTYVRSQLELTDDQERFVRGMIRDAILCG